MESICDDCKFIHSYVPVLQGHKIIRLTDDLDLKVDIEVDEPCSIHKGKFLDVYCKDHDKLCCSLCLATEHRKCEQVYALEDVAAEMDQNRIQDNLVVYKDLLESLENLQKGYREKITTLKCKKQEIVSSTEKKVEGIKSQIGKAHAQWLKRFEQKHIDSVGNIEIAADEVKRFVTTVQDAKTILQIIKKNGSSKQIFVTNRRLRGQVLRHINRLRALNIWDFVQDYNQQNTDFLGQVCTNGFFQDVDSSEVHSVTIQEISTFASLLTDKMEIAGRRATMCHKDWMKVTFEKIAEVNLPLVVYYGLFISDTKVIMSTERLPSLKVYDITNPVGECAHTFSFQSSPYGLCQSKNCIDIIYVSFKDCVDYYHVKEGKSVKLIKLGTFQLKEPMLAISWGTATIFAGNHSKMMLSSSDFSIIKHSSSYSTSGDTPFVSSSTRSDQHCFVRQSKVVVVDQNNTEIHRYSVAEDSPRGLAFDLQDNILLCLNNSNIKQIEKGGTKSRIINLPGIEKSYNVVLHPTGEKMMVLDYSLKCFVYKVS
jgi:hypothetical protein